MAEEDILFGKRRHLFGGIEPSNMIKFTARMDKYAQRVIIDAKLPADTVFEGQTLCSVAGAVIRRRADKYPKDEFDGVEIANVKESSTVFDPDVDVNATYYYAAFPYTTQDVYNRSELNRAVVNEPQPVEVFNVKSDYDANSDTATVGITIELSESSVGAYIRRSETRYPIDENDGELVLEISASGRYSDANVSAGTTYYYAAFPYDASGSVNRSVNNRDYCTPRKCGYYFGYDIDTTNPDPEARVSYPDDVDNEFYAPAFMDYTNGTFNYGDWPSEAGEKFMPRPCMLTYDGVVDHYLNPNDYTYRDDSTTDSKVADATFNGNAMMEWPKIYTKREEIDGVYKFRCSDRKHGDDWECWCNYDKNDNEIDHFYTSIYPCSGYGGKLRSISGLTFTPKAPWNGGATATTSGSTMRFTDMIGYAQLNGDDWYTDVIADRLLIQDLLVMMAKTTDCQTAYGNGVVGVSSSSDAIQTSGYGNANTKGLFNGYNNQTNHVKVFGMEHWWGNYERCISGLNAVDLTYKLKITRGLKDGTSVSDYNTSGDGYRTLGRLSTTNSEHSGYINKCETTPFGRIPVGKSGSSTNHECDGIEVVYLTTVSAACVGGGYNDKLYAGPFKVELRYGAGTQVASTLTGLSCKPSK